MGYAQRVQYDYIVKQKANARQLAFLRFLNQYSLRESLPSQ